MEDKDKIFKYLKSHELMTLATTDKDQPHAAILYYGIDKNLNMYIVTPEDTAHAKDININNHVACAVFDSSQKKSDKKTGMQITGTIKRINDPVGMAKALAYWTRGDSELLKVFKKNIFNKIWSSRIFIIYPAKIKWFNEVLFGTEGVREYNI